MNQDLRQVYAWAESTSLGTVRHDLDRHEKEEAVAKAVARLWRVIERGGSVNRECVWLATRRQAWNEARAKRRVSRYAMRVPDEYFEDVEAACQNPDSELAVWSACQFAAMLDPVASMVMLLVGVGYDFTDAEYRVRGPLYTNRRETRERMRVCYSLWEAA